MAKNLSRKPLYFSVNINLLRFLANIFNKRSLFDKVFTDFKVDNSSINKDIGWKPRYNLELGIKNTCFWYKTMFKIQI